MLCYNMLYYIILYYIILWDHRSIWGPSLTETSLCGAWQYFKYCILVVIIISIIMTGSPHIYSYMTTCQYDSLKLKRITEWSSWQYVNALNLGCVSLYFNLRLYMCSIFHALPNKLFICLKIITWLAAMS